MLVKFLRDAVIATQTYDKSNGVAVSSRPPRLLLVVLVVHEKILLPQRINGPTLVCVRCSRVSRARNDGRRLAGFADLVGRVVDGQGVLVVAVADVTAVVFRVRAAVFDALGI